MTTTHILVLPGGGYSRLADHESEPVAQWLRGLGFESSVHRYPVLTRHPGPLESVRARVAELRAEGVDRVGLLGFSAGGHLAGHAAFSAASGVDLVMLCYPVVSMQLETHAGSRHALIGPDASAELRAATSVDRLVTASAPPTFVWHTADDAAVPVEHSYLLGSALAAHGVEHELHVLASGEHGLGLAPRHPAGVWTGLAERWLARVG